MNPLDNPFTKIEKAGFSWVASLGGGKKRGKKRSGKKKRKGGGS